MEEDAVLRIQNVSEKVLLLLFLKSKYMKIKRARMLIEMAV